MCYEIKDRGVKNMLRQIDLTDREIYLIYLALLSEISNDLETLEAVTDPFTKKSLQNSVNELKSLRAKFVELL